MSRNITGMLTDHDIYLFKQGNHFNLHEKFELNYNPYSFYLKVVKRDLPLRIDFLTLKESTNVEIKNISSEIEKVVLAISEFNPYFSLPAPIIEADARSRISQREFKTQIETLQSMTFGSSSLTNSLKRNGSPFKF